MPNREPPPPQRAEGWQQLVDALAAVASIVLVLYGVGGVVVAAQLFALGLPIDAALAQLPTSALLVAALRALGPGLVGAAVLLWIVRARSSNASDDSKRPEGRRRRLEPHFWFLIILVLVTGIHLVLERPTRYEWVAVPGVYLLIAVLGVAAFKLGNLNARTVFPVLLVIATFFLSLGLQRIPPTPVDYVTVRLKDGSITDGYYLASTATSLYLAPNVLNSTVGDISVIPQRDVKSYKVELYEREFRLAYGWDSAPYPDYMPEPSVRVFHAIRRHAGWLYPPIMPGLGLDFVFRPEQSEFLYDFGPAGGDEADNRDERVRLKDLVIDPTPYVGKTLDTEGRVRDFTRAPDEPVRTDISLQPLGRGSKGKVSCTVPKGDLDIDVGTRVRFRAVVIAWGSARFGRDTTNLTALVCSNVRPATGSPAGE